jgi:hypothetical protein
VQKPSKKKTDYQCKKYQQRARHGDIPEQKAYLHWGNILNEEDHGKTCKDNNQDYFKIHLFTYNTLSFIRPV